MFLSLAIFRIIKFTVSYLLENDKIIYSNNEWNWSILIKNIEKLTELIQYVG